MKLSLNWIKDYVKLPDDMDLSRLAYDLTMSTVEVEGAENLAEKFNKIIVFLNAEWFGAEITKNSTYSAACNLVLVSTTYLKPNSE